MFERAPQVGLGVGPPYSVELTEKSSISCWDNDLQRQCTLRAPLVTVGMSDFFTRSNGAAIRHRPS